MKFSIIMPYYKNAHIVNRSIDSIVAQSVQDFELVIVDDGSKDEIATIVESYQNPKIKLIKKENGGVSSTRNCGITNASGDYICFLDSDDSWYPDHLEELSKMIDAYPEKNFFLTSHVRMGANEFYSANILRDFDDVFVEDDFIKLCIRHGEIIHTNSVCLKRDFLLQQPLFDTSVSIGEDTDLWFRCAMQGSVVVSKKTTTVYYRDNSFLTKNRAFNYDWPFLKQYETACQNNQYSVKLMCDRYLLASCKHRLADGDKKNAKKTLRKIQKPVGGELKKSYMITRILVLLPLFAAKKVCQKVYGRQVKNY